MLGKRVASIIILLILVFAQVSFVGQVFASSGNWVVKPAPEQYREYGWEIDYYFRNEIRVYLISVGYVDGRLKLAINMTDIPNQKFGFLYIEDGNLVINEGYPTLLEEIRSENVVCNMPVSVQEVLEKMHFAKNCLDTF